MSSPAMAASLDQAGRGWEEGSTAAAIGSPRFGGGWSRPDRATCPRRVESRANVPGHGAMPHGSRHVGSFRAPRMSRSSLQPQPLPADRETAVCRCAEATRVWAKIALLSFGGPAGQIALMHRVLVEEKTVDRRGPVPARAQLLHAPARPGGAAARHLYRLADAPHEGRADRRHPVRPARASPRSWSCPGSMPRPAMSARSRPCSSGSRRRCSPSSPRRCAGSARGR